MYFVKLNKVQAFEPLGTTIVAALYLLLLKLYALYRECKLLYFCYNSHLDCLINKLSINALFKVFPSFNDKWVLLWDCFWILNSVTCSSTFTNVLVIQFPPAFQWQDRWSVKVSKALHMYAVNGYIWYCMFQWLLWTSMNM